MIRHYKPNEESNKEDGIGFGSSDPTPSLPEREGAGNHTNESFTAEKTDAQSIPEKGEICEKEANPGNGTGGRKPGYITANPYTYPFIKDYRKDLKDHQTEAELVLWEFLRNKKTGHKIRRQHVIDNYIPDFVCLSKKVIIEIDGEIHKFQKEQDEMRTSNLNKYGYEVIRFSNDEVMNSPDQVAQKIKIYLNNRQV